MSDITKVIEYKITGDASQFNKVVQEIERMAGKQPINLSFNFDTGEIRGKLGEINSLIQKVVAKGKNNELALKISGIEVLQDRLKQIDSSVQSLAMRFANMHQSVDFSSEIDKNAKAIVRMDAQMERSMAALQDARKNRNKTADTFFGQINTKKNISEIMGGADLEALSKSAGSNFSQIVEQIVLASTTVDGLNKQIQLTEDKSVSLQEVFNKIVSTISGTSIQDFFDDGNFSMERVYGFIDEFSNKLSNMKLNFSPALQEAFKNMFASNVFGSQAGILQEEFDKAVEKQKVGQISVNIDKESINALAGAIGQLKAVIGGGEGQEISFGIKAEDIKPVTDAINNLGETITNIHNLLNQFDIPKIQTDGIDDVKNKLDEAAQSAEKLKDAESKPSTGDGWNVDQIKQVIDLLGELRDGLNKISEANNQEAITQRFADMGTEISSVILKLGELKTVFEGIDFNMTIKTNGNPIQQNADIAKQKRDAIDIYKNYQDALFDEITKNQNKLSKIENADGVKYSSMLYNAVDTFGDFKPKSGSASALYDYYSEMINKLKQLFAEAGIDISSVTSQFEPQLSEVNNKIRSIGDTGQQVERSLKNIFGGNLNVDNSLNVDTINQSMLELKSVLEQIQQILSVGLGINLDEQGPVYTYFDKILQKIQEINEAVKLFSDTINSIAPQIPNGGGSSGNKKRALIPAIGNGKLSRIDIRGDKDDNELGRTETYVSNTQGANVTRKINIDDNGQTVNTAIDYKKALEEATTALKNYERAVEELVKAKSALDNPDGTKSQNALVQGLKEAQEAADLTKQKLDDLKITFEKNPLLQTNEKNAFKERIDKATNVYTDPTIGEVYQKNKGRIIGKLQKEIEDFQAQYDNFVNNANGKFFGDTYDQSVKNMQAQMQQLLSLGIDIENIDLIGTDDVSRAKELLDAMKQTISAANKDASMLGASSTAKSGLAKSIGVYLGKNTKLSEGRRAGLESLFGELQGDVTVQRLDEIKNKFNEISAAAAMAGETGRSFGDQLATSFSRLSRYILSFASFYRIIGIFKQAVSIVKELDSALMEVRKVSSESASSLERWQKSTFNQANEVGGNAKQIQESTATWLRLGKSFKESQEAAQASVKLLNVSEFENIDDATTSLVSMRQAFKDLSYEDFIDKLNGVGDNFSSSTDQLAYGMRNVSSVLKVAGNDIDQSLALLTAAKLLAENMETYFIEHI